MEYKEAICNLRPNAIIAVKLAGEAIVRTAIFFMVFIAVLIILNLYNNNYYLTYFGFIIGSLMANFSYVMNKWHLKQKPLEESVSATPAPHGGLQ